MTNSKTPTTPLEDMLAEALESLIGTNGDLFSSKAFGMGDAALSAYRAANTLGPIIYIDSRDEEVLGRDFINTLNANEAEQ